MLKDMEFERAWENIKPEDRMKFLAQQVWDVNKRCDMERERMCKIEDRLKGVESIPPLSTQRGAVVTSAVTGATGGTVIMGVIIAVYKLMEYLGVI